MRLFVAADLPPAARAEAARRRDVLLVDALRPVPDAALHLTLAFLGERAERDVEALGAALAPCAASARDLELGAARWLPRRRPRVLALDVADRAGELRALQACVARAVGNGEDRPWLPHVTLARVRRGERVRPTTIPSERPLTFEIAALTLYDSHPGSRYDAVRTYPL